MLNKAVKFKFGKELVSVTNTKGAIMCVNGEATFNVKQANRANKASEEIKNRIKVLMP